MTRGPLLSGKRALLGGLALWAIVGCASLSSNPPGEAAQIQIAPSDLGTGLEVHPPVVRIAPGGKVSWTNQTTYDLQINFEPSPSEKSPAFISQNSSAEMVFDEAGTYSYTLFYSSTKTFGKVTGKIIVQDPNRSPSPFDDEDGQPRRKRIPDSEPQII